MGAGAAGFLPELRDSFSKIGSLAGIGLRSVAITALPSRIIRKIKIGGVPNTPPALRRIPMRALSPCGT